MPSTAPVPTVTVQVAVRSLPSVVRQVIVATPSAAPSTVIEPSLFALKGATPALLVLHSSEVLEALSGVITGVILANWLIASVSSEGFSVRFSAIIVETDTLQVAFTPLPSIAIAVIVVIPFFCPVTFPFWSTEAIVGLSLTQ